MKINVKNYPNLKQEVLIGDRVIVEIYEGKVIGIKENLIKINFGNGKIESWDKDYVTLIIKKKNG